MRYGVLHNPYLQLMSGAVLISFSAVFVAISDAPSIIEGLYRNFLGAVILLPYIVLTKRKATYSQKGLVLLSLTGFVFFCDLYAWHKAIEYVGPGLSTLLGNCQVFYLVAFGIFFYKEPISLFYILSVIFGITGLYLIVGNASFDPGSKFFVGVVYGILTSLSYAAFTLLLRYILQREPRESSLIPIFYISCFSSLFFFLGAIYEDTSVIVNTQKDLLALGSYALVSQVVGWGIISKALPRVRASLAGLVLLLQPVLSYVWEVIFFGKNIATIERIGISITLVAIYMGLSIQKSGDT